MSPRPYRSGQRQVAIDQTRIRIVAAARELLTRDGGFAGFTLDRVARQAGVARMTVYYQFGSKLGLLEALFDDVAARGHVAERLAVVFGKPEPLDVLASFFAALGGFFDGERLFIRRLRALAALDPEVEAGLEEREQRRREGLRVVLRRISDKYGLPKGTSFDHAVDTLYALSSFESFDAFAKVNRSPDEVAAFIYRIACAALALPAD